MKKANFPTGLNYNEFYTMFLDWFRENYPNSTAPKNSLIEMFYDDYLIDLPIPSY